mmetsp:Transcript_5237/g.12615  ORF Transcript_5237/g.12615 Transcript_5237/m.12615 type:complete len:261 (+) Transcript_5237:51-833(+)
MLVRLGTQVVLCGLPEWPPLNGRRGVVSRDVAEDDGRVQVSLVGGMRYVFPWNLKACKALGPGDVVTLVGFSSTANLNGLRGVILKLHGPSPKDDLPVLVHGRQLEIHRCQLVGSRRPQQVLPAARHPQLPAGGLYRDQQAREDAALAAVLAGKALGRSGSSQGERDAAVLSSLMRGVQPASELQIKEDQALARLLDDGVVPSTEVTRLHADATLVRHLTGDSRSRIAKDDAALQSIVAGKTPASATVDDAALGALLSGM